MAKVNPKHLVPTFTLEDPQDGLFWHALSKEGLDLFNAGAPDFGTTSSETVGTPFENVRCVKCRPNRDRLGQWEKSDGAILIIPKAELTEDVDWISAGPAGDAHVRAGAALLEHGEQREPSQAESAAEVGNNGGE